MEREYRTDPGDICKVEKWDSSEQRMEAICSRLNKHMSRKERFLEVRPRTLIRTEQHVLL